MVAISHAQRAACALSASIGSPLGVRVEEPPAPMEWAEAVAGQKYAFGVWHYPASDTLHGGAVAWAAAAFADSVAAGC